VIHRFGESASTIIALSLTANGIGSPTGRVTVRYWRKSDSWIWKKKAGKAIIISKIRSKG
jgi:hypothetical protein